MTFKYRFFVQTFGGPDLYRYVRQEWLLSKVPFSNLPLHYTQFVDRKKENIHGWWEDMPIIV